ncbi:imelysin family protein [Wenyingzhuangia sp. IMCC45574]
MKHILILLSIVCLVSCKQDNDTENVLNTAFYKDYYQLNIFPAISAVKNELTQEVILIQNFKQSKNIADFNLLKTQWLKCAKAYAKARVYNFGLIKERFYDTNIYNTPINTEAIESYIALKEVYNTSFFNSKSTVTKGLGSLEYLIYHEYNPELAYSLLVNDDFRINYLLAATQEVLRQINLIMDVWENEYKETFILSEGKLCSENARCLAFNQLINILDITKVTKIGKTTGIEAINKAPKDLEAYRSKSSLILIASMLEEVKYVYLESNANFASIVNTIDSSQLISSKITATFKKIELEMTTFSNNLYDAINTDASTVKPIYDTLGELVILFSVDAASTLSVTVLPTDNDGD